MFLDLNCSLERVEQIHNDNDSQLTVTMEMVYPNSNNRKWVILLCSFSKKH